MEDRYPYLRFVIGAAPLLAGAVAAVVFLGGTISACQQGGFAGFASFVLSAIVAGVAWIGAMVWIESIQLFLDIEQNTRKMASQAQSDSPPTPSA